MKSDWQVREAKAELSAFLHADALVLSYTDYERLAGRVSRPRLVDFFRTWPNLEIQDRDANDFGREDF